MTRRYILFDALTPKQLLIAEALRRRIKELLNIEFIITTREYDAIEPLVKILSRENQIHVIGSYKDRKIDKVKSEAQRIIGIIDRLANLLNHNLEEHLLAGVSYPNPVEARIIYGLGKKLIVISDSPHSIYASTLSIPLANYLIYSWCIDRSEWKRYVLQHVELIPYQGFDELVWIRHIPETQSKSFIENLDLEEKSYVVIRPEEYKASYYMWKPDIDFWVRIALYLVEKLKLKVVMLPRYSDQEKSLKSKLSSYISGKSIIIPPKNLAIGPALAKHSLAVVSGGATMAREAAFYGVLGIITFPSKLQIDRCIIDMGFPLNYIGSPSEIVAEIKRYMRSRKDIESSNIKQKISMLKDLSEPVEMIIERLINNE